MADFKCTDDGLRELALFAGAGGGILGGNLLGWRTVCAVEIEPYPASVLCARQNDGILPSFPIWDDVRTFDGKPWRGIADVVSGGFPCQDISTAGNGVGIEGERSGLWVEMARIIGEVRPPYTFVENSPALTFRGLGNVLGDLAEMGYDARWGVFSAADVGARHERQRVWVVAHRHEVRLPQPGGVSAEQHFDVLGEKFWCRDCKAWKFTRDEPGVCGHDLESVLLRTADDVAGMVDRIAAIGNGQVPSVARFAWETLGGPV